MRKFTLGFICGGLTLAALLSFTFASTQGVNVSLFPVLFKFNGKDMKVDKNYATFNYNGHVYVPLRFVADSLDAAVSYDDQTRTISLDHIDPYEIFSEQTSNIKDDNYSLSINSTKSEYKFGEMIRIWSSFLYDGDDDVKIIAQSTPFLGFYIIDEDGNYYEDARFTLGQTKTMSKGGSFLTNFSNRTIRSYNNQFKSDRSRHSDMNNYLQPGTYTIGIVGKYVVNDQESIIRTEIQIEVSK